MTIATDIELNNSTDELSDTLDTALPTPVVASKKRLTPVMGLSTIAQKLANLQAYHLNTITPQDFTEFMDQVEAFRHAYVAGLKQYVTFE